MKEDFIMTLNNYPSGVSFIPGDFDKTVSFTATWLYEDYFDDYDHTIESIERIAKDTLHPSVTIDPSTVKFNQDNETFSVDVTFEDDIDLDVHYMDYDEIEDAIINYLNHIIDEQRFLRNDKDLDISFEVHN